MNEQMQKYRQLRRKAKRYFSVMYSPEKTISEREAASIAYVGIIAEMAELVEEVELMLQYQIK